MRPEGIPSCLPGTLAFRVDRKDPSGAITLLRDDEPPTLDERGRPILGGSDVTSFALNHMTVARLSYAGLLDAAASLGCVGVEVRNDLTQPLFDGLDPAEAGAMARDKG